MLDIYFRGLGHICLALIHPVMSFSTDANMLDQRTLDEIYSFAIDLGKDAGQLLMHAAHTRTTDPSCVNLPFAEKNNSVDIVTKADEDTESFIKCKILERYPDHAFVGEESYSKSNSRKYLIDDKPTWVVDPLDGTVNYAHLFPMFCVSIGFVVDCRPVIGVIYAPMINQLFSSCLGRGLNETSKLPLLNDPIPPLPPHAPQGCIFSCEWGKDRRDCPGGNLARKVDSFMNMATELGGRGGKGGMVHGIRSLGSAALDLAYTATGSFDIWWEGGCWEWDVAAGIAIVEEAGGLVTSACPDNGLNQQSPQLGSRLYLAVRPAGPLGTESPRDSQERVVSEVWKRAQVLDYSRP